MITSKPQLDHSLSALGRSLFCLFLTIGLLSSPVAAKDKDKIKVVTSTTDIAWAARLIGGDRVEVTSLLAGGEDPHFVEALPKFIRSAANAEIVCLVGLGLEVGWMPKVLSKAAHPNVQPGGKGYCELGQQVEAIEKQSGHVDRSMGDVHPEGNPHFWLGPKAFIQGAEAIRKALEAVDPAAKEQWEQGYSKFKMQVEAAFQANQNKLKASGLDFGKLKFIQYHAEFSYFFRDYGLHSIEPIEEKPGVAPSAGRLSKIARTAQNAGVALALASEANPRDVMNKFQELSRIPLVIVPTSIKAEAPGNDYIAWQGQLIDRIIVQLKKR